MMQVKVWIGPEYSHYFVLSRFLLSRMLTVIRIDNAKVCSCSSPGQNRITVYVFLARHFPIRPSVERQAAPQYSSGLQGSA